MKSRESCQIFLLFLNDKSANDIRYSEALRSLRDGGHTRDVPVILFVDQLDVIILQHLLCILENSFNVGDEVNAFLADRILFSGYI